VSGLHIGLAEPVDTAVSTLNSVKPCCTIELTSR
jgi:hypothetical protein